MKWIERGITFEGTVSEDLELHKGEAPEPKRTRKGKSISIVKSDGTTITFNTLKDGATYITKQTGRYISAQHLSSLNGKTVELSSFEAGKEVPLFKNDTNELPIQNDEGPAKNLQTGRRETQTENASNNSAKNLLEEAHEPAQECANA